MRIDQDSSRCAKLPRLRRVKRIDPWRWGALGLLAATLAGCGATSHNRPGDGQEPDNSGNGAGTGQGGSSTAGAANGGAPNGGSVVGGGIRLDGAPGYYRFVRLTNEQWAASVQEVLQLSEPSGLEEYFQAAIAGATDFTNNELVLDVNSRAWSDFQSAAEALATQVTASDKALAAVYPGADSAGFIKTVGRRAYRRPLTAAEVKKCTTLFTAGAAMPGDQSDFAKGAALVIRALLQSPNFLYRTELGPTGEALSGYEAAAKISLWLRGSTPNDALLDEAEALSDPDALIDQATRMLAEPTATAVMRQFHSELLHLARLRDLNKINTPGYDPSLNAELEESSFLFFDKIFTDGLGVRDILTSTRGFFGKGMAPLYGLDPNGSGFVEQDLGPLRAGYFSQLPYLILNGHNQDPDSLHRGIGLALDVLCSPLGPQAAEIPPIPDRQPGQTSRMRIDAMTKGCGNICHNQIINPLGFAFEHFDGMGQYRDTETWQTEVLPIDSSGSYTFMDGPAKFANNVELMAAMASRPDAHLCYAKKLASFGLQRDIVASDLPWLNELAKVSQDRGSTQELMLHLIKDDAFRTRFGGAP
jgi:hypothetical protein